MSNELDIALLKNTLDQLLEKVTEIGETLIRNDERVRDLELKLNTVENESKNMMKEVEESRNKLKEVSNRAWGAIFSVGGTVIAGVLLWLIKGV